MFNSNQSDYPNPQGVSSYNKDIHNQSHTTTFEGSTKIRDNHTHQHTNMNTKAPVDMSRYARSPNHGHPSHLNHPSHSGDSSHLNHHNQDQNQNSNQTQKLNLSGLGAEFISNMSYGTNQLLGPISAPATTEFADDYFLFVGIETQDLEFLGGSNGQQIQQMHNLQNQQQQNEQQQFQVSSVDSFSFTSQNNNGNEIQGESQLHQFSTMYAPHKLSRSNSSHNPNRLSRRRTFSAQRPVTKSNLSLTYTGYAKSGQAIESPETEESSRESSYDNNIGGGGVSKHSSHKSSRNPGFRIKLDDLGPQPKKVMTPNPGSAGHFNSIYLSPGIGQKPSMLTEFQSPTGHSHHNSQDLYLNIDGGLKIDYQQETVTPLMFPPQTDNRDYFGETSAERNRRDSFLYKMHGGNFSANSADTNISGPLSNGLDNNHSNFVSVNDLQYSNSKRSYDQYNVMEEVIFDENLNDQKIEAHFTPVAYGGNVTPTQPQNGIRNDVQQPQNQYHEGVNHEDSARMMNHQQPVLASPYEDNRPQNGQYFESGQNLQQYEQQQYQAPHNRSLYHENGHSSSQSPHHQQTFTQKHNPQPAHFQQQSQPQALNQMQFMQQHQENQNSQQYAQDRNVQTQYNYMFEPSRTTTIDATKTRDSEENEEASSEKQSIGHQSSFQIETRLNLNQDVLPPQDKSDGSIENSLELKSSKKKLMKGTVCKICDRFISRDYSRHMRIHDEAGRFKCVFPPGYCNHKSRKFNRPYDYKKHLLNMHFRFDEVAAKLAPNLTEKLNAGGHCTACGGRFIASDWLDNHIMSKDESNKCYKLQELEQAQVDEWSLV